MKTPFKRTEISRSVRAIMVGTGAALALSAGGTALAAESGDLETPPSLSGSDDISDLKEQVRTLMDRIDELEQQQNASDQQLSEMRDQVDTVPANVVTAGDTPGSFKIPGTDTSISISGYVKGDFIYDLDADVGDSFNVAAAPADGTEERDNVRLHAKQSRLRVRSDTDLGNGSSIETHIEGDFFGGQGTQGTSNSDLFRMRHAYGQWNTPSGSFAAGQTWTLFGGFEYAPTVDFFAPIGQIFVRQAQVRWTTPGGFAVSLENPETSDIFANEQNEEDEFPDLIARWRGGPGGSAGTYSISGLVRQLGGFGVGIDGVPFDDDETGWAVHGGALWDFNPVSFTVGVSYGEGLGRYVNAGVINESAYAIGGQIETVEQLGATAGISFATGDTSSVNVSLGYYDRDDEFAGFTPTAEENALTVHTNYIWSPWPGTNFGFEVIYGQREQFDGVEGDATRLHFGAQRSF